MSTLWNTYAFYVLYAEIDQFDATKYTLDYEKLPVMDKWLLSKLNTLVKTVDENLGNYRIPEAARALDSFVDENGVGVTVEVNCETDFVANTDRFKDLCRDFAKHIAAAAPASVEEMLAQPFYTDASKTVNDLIGEATASIGEKISVRRFARFVAEHGMVDTYNHMGGRIGVMVELSCPEVNDEVKALSHDLVMHIAAANPQYVRRDEVPTDNLEKEREVLTQQALNEGKPAKIVERMVEGRIEKYYKEVCLLEQPFVKDPDINVTKMLGGKADVVRFVRFERGEGLEKRQDNLAADIAAEQAKMKK